MLTLLCLLTLAGSWLFAGLFDNGDDRAVTMFAVHLALLVGWWHLRIWPRGLAIFNLATLVSMAALILVAWDPAPPRAFFKAFAGAALALLAARVVVPRVQPRRADS